MEKIFFAVLLCLMLAGMGNCCNLYGNKADYGRKNIHAARYASPDNFFIRRNGHCSIWQGKKDLPKFCQKHNYSGRHKYRIVRYNYF